MVSSHDEAGCTSLDCLQHVDGLLSVGIPDGGGIFQDRSDISLVCHFFNPPGGNLKIASHEAQGLVGFGTYGGYVLYPIKV